MNIRKIEAQKQEVKKLRVAAYCRVSTDSDDQRDSLETQKQHFEAWIRLHSDWEYAGVFYDFGITGTKAEVRDGLQALLYECRIGRIDYVLTKSVSRFARNTVDCLSIVRELLSYGIPIYFEKENLDTGSMESELILSIISSLAQDELESISKNVKWSAQKRMENGSYKIGCVPYGYTKNEHGDMVIVPEEADVIQYIFNSVVSGMGVYKIAKNLNARHIPARKGGKWSTTTLLDILVNEKYVGDALFQKTYTDSNFHRHDNHGEMKTHLVQEHHEPIISRELFEKAGAILSQRAKERGIQKGSAKYQQRYAFSGRIICGQCGDKFKRQTYTSGITWACKTHLFHKSDCSMKYIRDDAVKAAFVTMMNKLIFARKLMLRPLCEALRIAGSDENLQRILHLKEELQHNAERKDELRKLRARGIIDSVLYNQEVSRIEKQSDEFRAEIKGLGNAESGSSMKEAERLLKYVESADVLSEFSDDLFADFVESITVYDRTHIGFQLKCGLTLKEELCTGTESKMESP